MSKEIKNKIVPKLRFPEFVNKGEWQENILGALVDIKGRIGYRGYTTADIVKEGEGAVTLSPSNFNENGDLNFEKCTYISWDKYEESPEIQLEVGQTVLVKTASVGKNAYVQNLPEKTTVNPQIVVLKPKKVHDRFLAYSISHQNIQFQIRNCVGSGAIPNLSQESISKFEVLIPPDKDEKEQQKIASCLSSLDGYIAAESQKLEALKIHKKGLMQQLFPAEGESLPKLRFPEFRDSGEWERKTLGEVADVSKLAGYEFTKHIVYEESGHIIALRGLNIKNNRLDLTDVKYIDNSELSKLSRSKLFIDDLLFTYIGTIGEVALIKENDKFYLAPNVSRIRTKKNKLDAKFILQFFNVSSFKEKEITKYISSSSQPALTMENVRKFTIKIPSLEEQQKIASCLYSLDDLITGQTEKIEELKVHKKGLMQGLFPKLTNY